MSVQSESQPVLTHRTGLEAKYGQYAVISVSAPAAEYAQVLALGQTIADEHGISPAMIQVTPLGPETTPAIVSGSHGRPDQGMKVGVVLAQEELQAKSVSSIRYLVTVTKSTGKR
ncbi:hypothetical protein KA344_10050 [bacterium]|jgi:hypothetical protein|nr:hypothetical protein [bacterium]